MYGTHERVKTAQGEMVNNYTGHASAGRNFKSTLTTKEIAAEIRKEVRKRYPAKDGYRIGVRFESYAGGSSISVDVKAAPFKIYKPGYSALREANTGWAGFDEWKEKELMERPEIRKNRWDVTMTDEANKLIEDLKDLTGSYRYDDSDGMIDYFHTNFYDHVQVHWETPYTA